MIDRESVVKGLEKCRRYECDDCTEKGASQAPWDCPAYDDFVDSAISLLKEQEDTRLIPRKPYHTKVEYANGHSWITDQCPECVERGVGIWDTLVDRYVRYCRRCGQALDWSEYNDHDKIDWDEYMSHVGERTNRISKRR